MNKSESLKAALEDTPQDKSKIVYPTDVTIVYSKECPIMQEFIKKIVEDLRGLGYYNLKFKTFVSSFEKFDFVYCLLLLLLFKYRINYMKRKSLYF